MLPIPLPLPLTAIAVTSTNDFFLAFGCGKALVIITFNIIQQYFIKSVKLKQKKKKQ